MLWINLEGLPLSANIDISMVEVGDVLCMRTKIIYIIFIEISPVVFELNAIKHSNFCVPIFNFSKVDLYLIVNKPHKCVFYNH